MHPDVGTFQIFSHGEWLIADDGYAFKRTIYQNTLTINSSGQIGEGGTWFNGNTLAGATDQPKIVYSKTSKEYDYLIGDAASAYPINCKLKYFYRHLLFLKPDCWIVADEVAADTTSLFEFYFHSDFPFTEDKPNHFTAKGSRGSLSVTLLKPNSLKANTFLQDIEGTGGGIANHLNVLKLSSENNATNLFITVLESYPSEENPSIKPTVVTNSMGDRLVIVYGNIKKQFKINLNREDKQTPLLVEVNN